MKVVPFDWEIMHLAPQRDIWLIGEAARESHMSHFEDDVAEETLERSNRALIKRCLQADPPHTSIIEHSMASFKFICSRAVANELTRHRHISVTQESTRYCNYSLGKFEHQISVVKPFLINTKTPEYDIWYQACENCESKYFELLSMGLKPEVARGVLPLDLKTELVVTANLAEWKHIFEVRTDRTAHPDIRALMIWPYYQLSRIYPEIFMEGSKKAMDMFIEDFTRTPDDSKNDIEKTNENTKEKGNK